MAEVVKMPRLSDTMEEGAVNKWHKKVGDKVKTGEIIADIDTDKATMEFESFYDGTLLYQGVKEGETVSVDAIIAIIGEKGEDYKSLLKEEQSDDKEKDESDSKSDKEPDDKDKDESDDSSDKDKSDSKSEKESQSKEKIDTSDINAEIVKMPRLSDTMEDGTVNKWHKKVGDKIKTGEILADIDTDKATMEFESFYDGVLLYQGVKEGEDVPVDTVIAVIGEKGADYKTLLKAAEQEGKQDDDKEESDNSTEEPKEEETEKPEQKSATSNNVAQTTSSSNKSDRVKASPLAKKIAEEKGIYLETVQGSGFEGRIIKRDIEDYQPPAAAQGAVMKESYTDEPASQMRKTIARRLSESKFQAPHFYLTINIDMDKAIETRKAINEIAESKISFNDLVIKGVCASLHKNPKVNASWLGDKLRYYKHIHIGVAVAVEEGLLVPVVRFADSKTLTQINTEVKDFAEKARDKKLQPDDMKGNTFTISNLGMYGIEEFTAIINPPDACILAVGAIQQVPVVKDGKVVPGNKMKVTLSCDHRVVDGAKGSEFLATFKKYLENPILLLGEASI